jgi:hypothetical protein
MTIKLHKTDHKWTVGNNLQGRDCSLLSNTVKDCDRTQLGEVTKTRSHYGEFFQDASRERYRYSNLLGLSTVQVGEYHKNMTYGTVSCVLRNANYCLITIFLTYTGSPFALILITIMLSN